jgi:DNA-binding transcriptional LysR family regulator
MMTLMDLEAVRAFAAFATADCNLTAAGRALGLSQPAMHARLRGLGRDLGAVLYERRGKKLALTAEGTRVLAWARDVLEREQRLRTELAGAADDARVVVACGEGALVHIVAARVAGWARAHPGMLSFRVVDGPTAVEAVRRGDAHLAVVAGPAAHPADLRAEALVTTSLCAVAPRRHVCVRDDVIEVGALLKHALLVPPPGRALRTTFEEAAAARGTALRVAVEVTGWEAVARLSALGVGVGVVNDVVVTAGLGRATVLGVPATSYRWVSRRGRAAPLVSTLLEALRAA